MQSSQSTDVEEIDRTLRRYPRLNCRIHTFLVGDLTIIAGADLHGSPPDVLLWFEDAVFLSAPTEWRMDTGERVISALDLGRRASCEPWEAALRSAFDMGGEHTIFELRAEGQDTPCRIGARSIRMTQMRGPVASPETTPEAIGSRAGHVDPAGGWAPERRIRPHRRGYDPRAAKALHESLPAVAPRAVVPARVDEITDVEEMDCELRAYPWFDGDVHTFLGGALLLAGGVDLHGPPPDALLCFEDVALMSLRSDWHTDTSGPVLSVLDGDEGAALRAAFPMSPEHTIFELRPEDMEGRCRVAARSVRMTRTRRPNEPLKLPEEWYAP